MKPFIIPLCLISCITINSFAQANAGIIQAVTDSTKGGGTEAKKPCDSITEVGAPVRAGTKAFKHVVGSCGVRAEFAFKKTEIGKEYWEGWSVYLPENFKNPKKFVMVAQWAAYPPAGKKRFSCGGVGHRMDIRSNGDILLRIASGKDAARKCISHKIGNAGEMKGKWTDFAVNAKWSEGNGFFRLWKRPQGEGLRQVVDYRGPTWWGDEGKGPYTKIGAYIGLSNKGSDKTELFTDEYRLGDENSGLAEVLPGAVGRTLLPISVPPPPPQSLPPLPVPACPLPPTQLFLPRS